MEVEKDAAPAAIAEGGPGAAAADEGCACRHKATPRSAELQLDVQKRLNRAIGQLNGVKAMVEDNRTCVVEEVRAGNDEVIDEVMALMRRFAK